MLSVLVQSLILASAGLFAFGSMTLVILLLMSERSWRNGLGYALGYLGGYTVLGAAAVVAGYRVAERRAGRPILFLPILLLMLGALLLWLGLRNWRRRASSNHGTPRFFAIVDRITPRKAFAFGALVTVINFKNLALFLSAISVILLSGLPLPEKLGIALLVAVVFCSSVLIPLLIYVAFPHRAADLLSAIKEALERHSRPIGILVPLLFGALFIIRGWTLLP